MKTTASSLTGLCLVGLLLLPLVFSDCAPSHRNHNRGKLKVVATTGMIGDAARVIGGDFIELSTLMGPGVDPHLYKATKGDIDRFHSADIIFYNGLHLEAKLTDIFRKMGRSKIVVPVAEAIPDTLIRVIDSSSHTPDPHVWFDLSMWRWAVEALAATLSAQDSVHTAEYHERTRKYIDSILTVHRWVIKEIATIPEERRVLVTAHDAFAYFGRAYDIDVVGLQGISTVTEAGLYDVTHMIDLLVKRRIKAVFVESSVSRKSINAVVNGCNARGHEVVIGGELFSDAMGTAGTPEGTYLGMVHHNVNTIVAALK